MGDSSDVCREVDAVSILGDCHVSWKSLSSIEIVPANDEKRLRLLSVSLINLLQFARVDQSGDKVGLDELESFPRYYEALRIASISIQNYLECTRNGELNPDLKFSFAKFGGNVVQAWVEHSDLLLIINTIFEEPNVLFAEEKKLALDLAFVLASHLMDFTDSSFGFSVPLTKWQHQLLLITFKLVESFVVTTPPHFPFMPAQFFAPIHWPVEVQESCSGKVHGMVTFGPMYDKDKGPSIAEDGYSSSAERKGEAQKQYCNYEVVSRRQPWQHMFSAIQLYQLALVVKQSKVIAAWKAASSLQEDYLTLQRSQQNDEEEEDKKYSTVHSLLASADECEEVLVVMRNVFRRIASVDPTLLYRGDKRKSAVAAAEAVVFKESAQCRICNHPVSSLLSRWNPLTYFGGTAGAGKNSSDVHGSCDASVASTTTESTSTNTSASVSVNVSITPLSKHHCRLCLETVCAVCCAPELWMNDRTCTACYSVVVDMGLQNLKAKEGRKKYILGTVFNAADPVHGGAVVEAKADLSLLSPEEQLMISILKGEPGDPVYTNADFIDLEDDEDKVGKISRCCSELMPASLRVWRDGSD